MLAKLKAKVGFCKYYKKITDKRISINDYTGKECIKLSHTQKSKIHTLHTNNLEKMARPIPLIMVLSIEESEYPLFLTIKRVGLCSPVFRNVCNTASGGHSPSSGAEVAQEGCPGATNRLRYTLARAFH